MKAIYKDCKKLDERAVNLGLDELILMENAGLNLADLIKKKLLKKKSKPRILFLLGGGNNAADGLVAARILQNDFKKIRLFCVDEKLKKSALFEKQLQIAKNLKLHFLKKEPRFKKFDVIVECIFGSGLKRALDDDLAELIIRANQSKALKIACDVPCGLGFKTSFKADLTATMGAMKELLLEDFAKPNVGKIKLLNLGLDEKKFAPFNESFLLEAKDLRLIKRNKSANKGDFGHGFIAASASAGTLAGLAALNFGAGLISLIAPSSFSPLIMIKERFENTATAGALGMGLLNLELLKDKLLEKIPLVLDANCFLSEEILNFLNRRDAILTPHPKEFTRLYEKAFNENLSVKDLQQNRFFYARKFASAFECVLVLKGANPIIVQKNQLFVVNLGNEALAKAGSGDALSGMILALLCAHFKPLEAAKNAVLAHALMAKKYKHNPNSFDALKLIKGLKCL
ncbi:bifunctional ADP-dependent NAD(P)H-hydrate dehydratase/NAD(P)H-hydrate epimerase [Campylobacter sp. MIT 99-7217]|uniref:NAD(P)H-hydrate dehydratase n=1 Tax=Campylobacter sp. MIT 99-7217 TaxID=535091 RepID=UPI0011589A6E|nr:NAD(P)H-hydrate dehydratase [Campylobacter sp. MIT 99-7217]TQR33738.1 bifunctional ADP-dependent NAD(P)H-hydrate dehydratase/NAD(P)H-hydrate epimerase [Campylobacter sp. MIT 99-7217]